MLNKAVFKSESSEWETPPDLYRFLDDLFSFTLDPCATPENAKCKRFFTKQDNGLRQSWGHENVFLNPPYGREIGRWLQKAFVEVHCMHYERRCNLVVCLIPARTDTKWWHRYAMRAQRIWLLKGRLRFVGAPSSAPFPSAIVVFNQVGITAVFRSMVKEGGAYKFYEDGELTTRW